MKTNIFRHEFQARFRSVVTWSIAAMAIILLYFALFPSFADQAEMMDTVLASFPPELLTAFGMDGLSMASIMGFFSFLFLFVQICLAIQAANYGFGLVSIEESELTADFLLAKPVKRTEIMTSKLLAALVCMTITNLMVWASSFAAVALFGGGREYDADTLLLLLLSIAAFQLFFFSVGLVVSLLVKRVRSVTPYALGLGFGMYALSAFSGIGEVSILELLTPFKHFDANYIVRHGAYDTPLVLLNVAVSVIALGASYWLYMRRDIPAVV